MFAFNRYSLAIRFSAHTDYLCINPESLSDADNGLCIFLFQINLYAMPHVEHLVHFFPSSFGLLLN